jgi:hypothetical protein
MKTNNMKNLTVIIPLIEGYDRTDLLKAVRTIKAQTLLPSTIVLSMSKIVDEEQKYDLSIKEVVEEGKIEVTKAVYRENDNPTTQDLINYAVSTIDTKYFIVMEHNEGLTGKTWLETVERYISKGYEYSVYLPLTKVIDDKSQFRHYLNEQWFAFGFTDEDLGVVSEEGLKNLFEMNLTGGVIDRETFIEIGGLKPNIKWFYWYEYALRTCFNNKGIYVIPKSLYTIPMKNLEGVSREEYQADYEKAQNEYSFNKSVKKL